MGMRGNQAVRVDRVLDDGERAARLAPEDLEEHTDPSLVERFAAVSPGSTVSCVFSAIAISCCLLGWLSRTSERSRDREQAPAGHTPAQGPAEVERVDFD